MTLSGRTQLWGSMIILAAILTLVTSYFAIRLGWEINTNWGPFAAHQNEILKIVKGFIFNKTYHFYDYRDYLNRNDFIDDFLLHISIPFVACLVISAYIAFKLVYSKGGLDTKRHISGPRLLIDRTAIKNAKRKLRKQVRKGDKKSLFIHPKVRLGLKNFTGNTFILGAIGSGKTNIIIQFLSQLISANYKAIIYDAKPEFIQIFLGYLGLQTVSIINPKDNRSLQWDIQKDIESVQDSKAIAEAFIAEDQKDPFWTSGARLIFTGIMESIRLSKRKWGWVDISLYLLKDAEELKDIFSRYYPQAHTLLEKESKTTQSFMMVLTNQLDWLHQVAKEWRDSEQSDFSVNDWIGNAIPTKQIIIPNEASYSAISAPLCSAIISMAVKYVMRRESSAQQIWFVLDELANIPKTDSLKQWLTMARSKGGRTIAGTQNFSQLESIYGDKDAETIFSQFSNLVCLRINSYESASKIAKQFGQRTISKKTESYDHQGNRSVSYTNEVENLIPEHYIMNLPSADRKGFWGFLSIKGWTNTYLLHWPYPNLPNKEPQFMPKQKIEADPQSTSSAAESRGSRGRATRC
jgi:type IV secretory pathway TraG/TraD family ATPase VirD4